MLAAAAPHEERAYAEVCHPRPQAASQPNQPARL